MIRRAVEGDLSRVAAFMDALWPGHTLEERLEEARDMILTDHSAVYVEPEGGFAHCDLRFDYVEGAKCCPVGYLEGIYVAPDFRGRGVAKALLKACEDWARSEGAVEFASDCARSNLVSRAFHNRCGFSEAAELIHFVKKL